MAGYTVTTRRAGMRGHVQVAPISSKLVFSRLQARELRGNGLSFAENLNAVRMNRVAAAHKAQLEVYGDILFAVPDDQKLQSYSQFVRYYRGN